METQNILKEKAMFAEMLSNSDEKIFLEAIDQFFEQDSPINYIENSEFDTSDIEIEKMNDKFCNSLDEDDCHANSINATKDSSTELDSEETPSQSNIFLPKKKLFMHDFILINQKSINKAKNQVLKEYYSKLQMMENLRNVWRK